MRGLAEPENFFLHLRQPREADLHGEIAARDHHRGRVTSRAGDDELRQVPHRQRRLDLQDDPLRRPVARGARTSSALQQFDVRRPLDEGKADEIGVLGDEIEIVEILFRQRRQRQFRRRES